MLFSRLLDSRVWFLVNTRPPGAIGLVPQFSRAFGFFRSFFRLVHSNMANQFELLAAKPARPQREEAKAPAALPAKKDVKLSKNIMSLKFMQRAANAAALKEHEKVAEAAKQQVQCSLFLQQQQLPTHLSRGG